LGCCYDRRLYRAGRVLAEGGGLVPPSSSVKLWGGVALNRSAWFWAILALAAGSVFVGFWVQYAYIADQYEGNAILNEQFHARNVHIILHQLLDYRNNVWDDLTMENEEIVIKQAKQLFGEDFLFVAWYDPVGEIERMDGEWIPDHFYQSNFFETILYSYGESLSEIAMHQQNVYLQTARLMDDDRIVLLGTEIHPSLESLSRQLMGRDILFFFGNEKEFDSPAGFDPKEVEVISSLFKRTMDAQRPMSEVFADSQGRSVFTAFPVYDADHWDVIGFVGIHTPFPLLDKGLFHLRSTTIWMSIFSSALAFFVLFLAFRRKNHVRPLGYEQPKTYLMKGFFAFGPSILLCFILGYGTVPTLFDQTTTDLWKESSPALVHRFQQNQILFWSDPQTTMREWKAIQQVEYILFDDEQPIESTISLRMASRLSEPELFFESNDYSLGTIELNRVAQKFVSFPYGDRKMMILREETDMLNIVLGTQFFCIGLGFSLIVLSLIFSFLIVNLNHPMMLKKTVVGYAFLAPALIHLIWWAAGPLAFSLFLAFRRWSVVDPAKPFVGMANFVELLQDGPFWNAMKNTAVFSLHVPMGMILSILLAMAVNKAGKVAILLRVLYYLPVVTAGVATTIVWRWIFNRDFGMLNYLLGFFGVSKIAWLDSPQFALGAIMIISIWGAMGSQMLIYLAGLQGIPKDFYDAASVDGANKIKSFRYITLPLLKPTSLFVLVTSVISSFQVFTPIYVLTQGGPLRSTDVVFYHIWESAWVEMRMGYAAAQSWILFGVLAILTLLEFRMFGKDSWKVYN